MLRVVVGVGSQPDDGGALGNRFVGSGEVAKTRAKAEVAHAKHGENKSARRIEGGSIRRHERDSVFNKRR